MKVKGNSQCTSQASSSIRFDLLVDLAAHHRKPQLSSAALIRSSHPLISSAALISAGLIRSSRPGGWPATLARILGSSDAVELFKVRRFV